MVYKEIPIELLVSNPFQTRESYDSEALVGIATSAMDEIGIRNPPLVRPHPEIEGRYQIASGHGRVAAWKTLGNKTILCRVENLNDSQMKKEVLVENVNRSDLSEEERFQALEQFREDLGLKPNESGVIAKLATETGIPKATITDVYDVQKIRKLLKVSANLQLEKKPSSRLIRATTGIPEEERLKLIVKAQNMGWSRDTTIKVKIALRSMEKDIRELILEKQIRLPYTVIMAIGELKDPEKQKAIIEYIKTYKLNEELALNFIEQAKKGPLILDIKRVDEIDAVFNRFNRVYELVSSLGYNEYKILGSRWYEALDILRKIRDRIDELLRAKYE